MTRGGEGKRKEGKPEKGRKGWVDADECGTSQNLSHAK